VALALAAGSTAEAQTVTNLHQLTLLLNANPRAIRDVDLQATVCAASQPGTGVLIARDDTGVELLQLGAFDRAISPGQRIRIRHASCWLRKRELGVEISALPVVSNDGLHARSAVTGVVALAAGDIPLRLEWFNYWREFALEVSWATSNQPPRLVDASNLWHAVPAGPGTSGFSPGLRAECYEGAWEELPDFNLLRPAKTGWVTNFDLDFRSRDESVGLRYSGYLRVPSAGRYRFTVWSDDGAALFLGDSRIPIVSLGVTAPPAPQRGGQLEAGLTNLNERFWTRVEGRVSFVSRLGAGLRLDLGTDGRVLPVAIADASGLDPARLRNARVRITGIGRGALTWDQTPVLGRLFAVSAADLVLVEPPPEAGAPTSPITSVAQVQSLPIERARQGLPVQLRGIVTGAFKGSFEHWMSLQDDTRGVFVTLAAISDATPAVGEMWEVAGHSAAGNFAPIVVAERITCLGEGLPPAPVQPTWTELLNGSRDVQWAELKGVVTDVHSNTIGLHLPEGRLEVMLDGSFESDLKPFQNAVVTIRGVLYAVWGAATREVRVGRVMMRGATIGVEVPAPTDPFDAVVRTPRQLLLFDAQASAFRPVKVRGQIAYADTHQLILEEDGMGLRLLPVEATSVRPGDLVEAVGYSDIGRLQLQLREVRLRKLGSAPLPPPRPVAASALAPAEVNSTRVRVEGKLLGWHVEEGTHVLEMQSGSRLYQARIAPNRAIPPILRPGSELALVGVVVGRGLDAGGNDQDRAFELLLNSPADASVLSRPSWWTLPRLFALVGVLLVILTFTIIWNTQLRWLVEQRTRQLQREIRERERVERRHALEAERSRIARDLHDDLGSSLTEISVLANSGQLRQSGAEAQPGLFQTIGAKARALVSALDVIVWAVDPEDNSLQSLGDYLSGYAGDFFSHTPVACRFKMPVSFPAITLEGRVRHELLMAVKEALNNVVRHADATEVEFRMALADGRLEIDLADNGKGLEPEESGDGHGLRYLSARMRKLGGDCALESPPGGGTIVKFRLPLPVGEQVDLGAAND
jgi:signal transduction histidine kinase